MFLIWLYTYSLVLKTSFVLADFDLFYGKTSRHAAGREMALFQYKLVREQRKGLAGRWGLLSKTRRAWFGRGAVSGQMTGL